MLLFSNIESQAKLPFPSDFFPSHQTSQDTSNVSVDKATVSFPYKVTGFHHSYRLPLQLLNTAEWYCTRQFPSGYTWKEQFSLVCYLIITVQNNSNPNFEISCNCQNILHLKITVTKNRERERELLFPPNFSSIKTIYYMGSLNKPIYYSYNQFESHSHKPEL